jgi:maleylpyruvate isomerase
MRGAQSPDLGSAMRPNALIAVCIAGHRRVARTVARLADHEFQHPSLLPGWTRADVVAWLALKSRSHVHIFDGAMLGEVRSQFPDGYDQPAEVREEAARTPVELRANLTGALDRLEGAWARLPDDLWTSEGVTTAGTRVMTEIVARHLRDVEAHHVDLDVGYEPSDWPTQFVELELAKRLRDLPGRADPSALLAWLLGRGSAPELGPW